jgi:hypothetical protein
VCICLVFYILFHDKTKWNFRTPKPPIDSLGNAIFEEFESLVKEESSGDEGKGEKIYNILLRHLYTLNKYC